jgi:probable HAF family extracellular repeat protein
MKRIGFLTLLLCTCFASVAWPQAASALKITKFNAPGAKTKTDLGTLGLTSEAFSINSQSQVVGASRVNNTTVHAFLWERGEIVDLNDLVSPKSDVQLQYPIAIADNGEIAINGMPKGCFNVEICGHPYVLIPNGTCDDDCEARIAASRNNTATLALDAGTVKQRPEAPLNRVNVRRNRLIGRYHIPGQPAVPSD